MEGSTSNLGDNLRRKVDFEEKWILNVQEHHNVSEMAKRDMTNLQASEQSLNDREEYIKIVEQPAPKALRFRYECEGRSAGSIPGISSTPENKTYPTIQVVGYSGRAVVVVSCVTKEEPHWPHPHNLVGREGCKKGVCTLEIPPDSMTVSFPNLGIQCVKKKDVETSLKTREEIRVDPFRTGFSHINHPSTVDLNAVRLCFQVFLEGDKKGKFTIPLTPVVSEPIYDKKAAADLVILKLSDCNSYVDGGRKDIILLCEKVSKEDIEIRFFEEKDGRVIWEAFGDFQPNQVHKQTAIWFKTPKYRTLEVTEPVKAFIQLRRPSDGATSEALPFEFLPLDAGRPLYWSLGRTMIKKRNHDLFRSFLNENRNIFLQNDQQEINKNLNELIEIETDKKIFSTVHSQVFDNSMNENNVIHKIGQESHTDIIVEDNNNEINVLNKETPSEVSVLEIIENNWKIPANENSEEKTFNRLIDEVAELDEIYSTSHCNKNSMNMNVDVDENIGTENRSFDDSKTYSSLQLALKNPLTFARRPTEEKPQNITDTIPEENNFDKTINKRELLVEKLPPLPPKRQKKTETYIGENDEETRRLKEALLHPKPTILSRSQSFNANIKKNIDASKYLGSTSTLPSPRKKGFFSKLFGRKNKNKSTQDLDQKREAYPSNNALQRTEIATDDMNLSISGEHIPEHLEYKPMRTASIKSIGNVVLPHGVNQNNNFSEGKSISSLNLDLDTSLDLTEAENYALYTVMAPHATQSEFDEMSCYYAAVEGGKILS